MIITVEGKIGSGKTYWAVNFLVEKYYEWKEELFTYVPKGNLRVITNIRDLQLPHINLDDEIANRGGLEKVFNENYPGLKDANTQTIFVIDEAQAPNYFHRKYYNPTVFLFFQKSRHLGIDVLLITQDRWTLCKEIQTLSEYNVVAVPRSVRTKNVFMYKYVHGNEVGRRKAVIFSKRVAALYRSFDKVENEKVTYLWKKYAIAIALAVVVVMLGFKVAMGTFFNSNGTKSNQAVFGGKPNGASSPASTGEAANDAAANYKGYVDAWGAKNGGVPNQPGQKQANYRKDGKTESKPEPSKAPESGPGIGVVNPNKDEDKAEPLVPMKCESPDDRGWQECFEGQKYVGRMKVIKSTVPEYGKAPRHIEPSRGYDPKVLYPKEPG